ncbi:unnamed protein product [Acanthoscelides obtectus]|uniref:Uncharacterized protein n=1 Tax=Acanthoscelides obtectus TaxID=200917 RepID=A0A9P0PV47_ACAOB|nr:unnamed protein product [Acanthoscelides obtectus]CAK1635326.1 hypothetical protein AOBTE_LOCUS9206 [Acanthoscelides obtectus]
MSKLVCFGTPATIKFLVLSLFSPFQHLKSLLQVRSFLFYRNATVCGDIRTFLGAVTGTTGNIDLMAQE